MQLMPDMDTDARPLQTYRKQNQLTLIGLAEMLGVSKVTVFRWETGAFLIPVSKLNKVSEITGIPREQLRPDIFGKAA